jgi:hypothetical protein
LDVSDQILVVVVVLEEEDLSLYVDAVIAAIVLGALPIPLWKSHLDKLVDRGQR